MMLKNLFVFMSVALLCLNASAQTTDVEKVLIEDAWSEQAENITLDDIESLKNQGFDFRSVDESGNTMFYYVLTLNGNPENVSKMIDYGADVNQPAANGMLPLNVATSKANELQLQVLMMQTMGLDIHNPQIKDALASNVYAEMKRMAALVQLLLARGADVNKLGPLGTPLMNAATNAWNVDIVKLLIDAGADLNQTDPDGKSALFYAAASGNDEIINLLIQAGADPNLKDAAGKTYLEVEKTAVDQTL